jgi:hypothetical protein
LVCLSSSFERREGGSRLDLPREIPGRVQAHLLADDLLECDGHFVVVGGGRVVQHGVVKDQLEIANHRGHVADETLGNEEGRESGMWGAWAGNEIEIVAMSETAPWQGMNKGAGGGMN